MPPVPTSTSLFRSLVFSHTHMRYNAIIYEREREKVRERDVSKNSRKCENHSPVSQQIRASLPYSPARRKNSRRRYVERRNNLSLKELRPIDSQYDEPTVVRARESSSADVSQEV